MGINLSKQEDLAYHSYVHTPTEAQAAFVELGRQMYGSQGISSGSRVLDYYMIPTRQAWVRGWVAAPGNGKTTQLRAMALNTALWLKDQGLDDKHYVAYLDYETAVDSGEILFARGRNFSTDDFWRGKVDEPTLIKASITRPSLPIYVFGESMLKSDINTPPMTIDMCLSGMRAVYKIEGKTPWAIFLDYIQEIVVDPNKAGTRTEKVIQGMRDVIGMGIRTKAGIEIGVQAKQVVLEKNPPIPDQNDIEWAFFVYQKCNNMVSIWRPWTTHRDNLKAQTNGIPVNNQLYTLSENLVVAKSLKHRPGVLAPAVPYELDPDTMEIRDNPRLLKQLGLT